MFNLTKKYALVRDPKGHCQVGGEIPKNFSIPENSCPGSFQYLGLLSKDDDAFNWLNYDINLICPIYMDIETVWIDYSQPTNPTILNLDEVNELTTAYDDLKPDSLIVYEEIKCSSKQTKGIDDFLGLAGKPQWVQGSETPTCPMSGRKMKFLCQLTFQYPDKINTKHTNIECEDEYYQQYFQEMNFWGDGDLYVFFCPESNVACYFIQNT